MAARKTSTKGLVSTEIPYQIVSRQSGNAVSVESSETDNGALLAMDAPNKKDAAQSWKFVAAKDGSFRIVSTTSGKCMDVIEGGTENGAWLHLWDSCETDTQLWKLEPASRGYFRIVSLASGKHLDIVDISSEAGAHLQIWEGTEGENQEWKLVKLAAENAKNEVKAEAQPAAPKQRKPRKPRTAKAATEKPVVAPFVPLANPTASSVPVIAPVKTVSVAKQPEIKKPTGNKK